MQERRGESIPNMAFCSRRYGESISEIINRKQEPFDYLKVTTVAEYWGLQHGVRQCIPGDCQTSFRKWEGSGGLMTGHWRVVSSTSPAEQRHTEDSSEEQAASRPDPSSQPVIEALQVEEVSEGPGIDPHPGTSTWAPQLPSPGLATESQLMVSSPRYP